jgi:hypothetical protein
MNGVASGRLFCGWGAVGLFIPRRKLAIISCASSIRLFFFIMKLLCELWNAKAAMCPCYKTANWYVVETVGGIPNDAILP